MTFAKLTTPNNIEICCEVFGEKPQATPIELFSGAGLKMVGWLSELFEMLAGRGHRVIRFDNRDTGESTNQKRLTAPNPWRVELTHNKDMELSFFSAGGYSYGCNTGL